MAKLTPNIPYDDLGDFSQLAEYCAAWVMESNQSVNYLALSDFRPERCGSRVVRRASFEDVEALASGLPMLCKRSYRIGCEQGIVVVEAVVIDQQYRWAVALEPPVAVEINNLPVVPRRVVDRVGIRGSVEVDRGSEGFGVRSALVGTGKSPRLLIRR